MFFGLVEVDVIGDLGYRRDVDTAVQQQIPCNMLTSLTNTNKKCDKILTFQ